MMKLASFIFLAAMTACLGPQKRTAEPVPAEPPAACTVSAQFHGDVDFSVSERADTEAAMRNWKEATGGAACMNVTWDLDFSKISSIVEHQHDNVILRVSGESEMVQGLDEEVQATVLGLALPHGGVHSHEPIRLFLVHDRLTGAGKFVGVVTHELGHTLGLQHTRDTWSLMYPAYRGQVCISRSDLSEFCRVNKCEGHKMKPCDD